MATNRKYQTLLLRYWHYLYRAHQPSTGGVIDKYYYLFLWRNCVERNKSSWKRIILYNIDSAFNMLVCQTEAKTTYRINDTSWFICLAYIDLKFFLIQKIYIFIISFQYLSRLVRLNWLLSLIYWGFKIEITQLCSIHNIGLQNMNKILSEQTITNGFGFRFFGQDSSYLLNI